MHLINCFVVVIGNVSDGKRWKLMETWSEPQWLMFSCIFRVKLMKSHWLESLSREQHL